MPHSLPFLLLAASLLAAGAACATEAPEGFPYPDIPLEGPPPRHQELRLPPPQVSWDDVMRDLLPPDIYERRKRSQEIWDSMTPGEQEAYLEQKRQQFRPIAPEEKWEMMEAGKKYFERQAEALRSPVPGEGRQKKEHRRRRPEVVDLEEYYGMED